MGPSYIFSLVSTGPYWDKYPLDPCCIPEFHTDDGVIFVPLLSFSSTGLLYNTHEIHITSSLRNVVKDKWSEMDRVCNLLRDSINKGVCKELDGLMDFYLQKSGGMAPIGDCVFVYEKDGPDYYMFDDHRNRRIDHALEGRAGAAILC
jgi:hypothetical protein